MEIFITKSFNKSMPCQDFLVKFKSVKANMGKLVCFTIPSGDITAIWERKLKFFNELPYTKL